MKWVKKYVWGILAAIGGVALAVFCLAGWWQRRKTNTASLETVSEVLKRNVERAKQLAEIKKEKAKADALKAVTDAQTKAVDEVDNERKSLADRLAGLGAGNGGSFDDTKPVS